MVAMYCNQGDNTGDAINLANQVVQILTPKQEKPGKYNPTQCTYSQALI